MPRGTYERTARHKKRISDGGKKRYTDVKEREKTSKAMKGSKSWNKGLTKDTDKRVKRQSERIKGNTNGFQKGERNPMWIDGKTLFYSDDWRDTLRESIRQRDSYICQLCGIHQGELDKRLDIHHIDYDKKNCDPKNLISLCRSCHLKTNHNRERWLNYFLSLISSQNKKV